MNFINKMFFAKVTEITANIFQERNNPENYSMIF